jgi:hypothetical protein
MEAHDLCERKQVSYSFEINYTTTNTDNLTFNTNLHTPLLIREIIIACFYESASFLPPRARVFFSRKVDTFSDKLFPPTSCTCSPLLES